MAAPVSFPQGSFRSWQASHVPPLPAAQAAEEKQREASQLERRVDQLKSEVGACWEACDDQMQAACRSLMLGSAADATGVPSRPCGEIRRCNPNQP